MSAATRVLIVDPSGELYGSEQVLLDLLAHLDRGRIDVTVGCPPSTPLWDALASRGEQCVAVYTPRGEGAGGLLRSVWSLRRAVIQVRPDIVHLNQAGPFKHVALALRGLGTPLLVHIRLAEDAAHVQARAARWLAPDGLIAISHYIRHLLPADARATTLYDPFDASAWRASVQPVQLRANLGLSADTPVVLFVGRICATKGVDVLVEAAGRLSSEVHVAIVGAPPVGPENAAYAAGLHAQATQLGVAERLHWLGRRSDVAGLVTEASVLAVPSRTEPLGRVLFEALSVGTPVVASSVGGMVEVVGADERGWAVPPDDAQALAATVTDALARPLEAARRTAAGAKWVATRCEPAAHARAVEQLYQLDWTPAASRASPHRWRDRSPSL